MTEVINRFSGHISIIYFIRRNLRFLYKGIIIKHNKNRANLH